jgi:type I restriction enzyme S subunit
MNPQMKEFDWLQQIPSDWKLIRVKYISILKGRLGWQNLRSDEYTEEGPYLVTSEHFINDRIDWNRCYHVTETRYAMAPEIQLRLDDLLMMKDGAAMGKLAYVEQLPGKACLNSHLLLFRPIKDAYFPRYLYYVLASIPFHGYLATRGTGSTFLGISQRSIGEYLLALPMLGKQKAIATFLDRKTAAIDTLIAKKQRLIQLLEEKRAALINQAVTKGLNPDVPMKDSGIPWIGQIPEHWEVTRSKISGPI